MHSKPVPVPVAGWRPETGVDRVQLAGVGRRATNQALARRDADKRYPVLLATAAECAVEVLDELIYMFDQALSNTENRARRKLDEALAQRAGTQEDRLTLLDEMLTVATDLDNVPDAEVGAKLRSGSGYNACAPPGYARSRTSGHS